MFRDPLPALQPTGTPGDVVVLIANRQTHCARSAVSARPPNGRPSAIAQRSLGIYRSRSE